MRKAMKGVLAGALVASAWACGGTSADTGLGAVSQAVKPTNGTTNGAPGNSDNEVKITQTETAGPQCGSRSCFHIEADKNITHVFLDFGECPVEDFRVLAETPFRDFQDVTDRLKTQGGPCQDLELTYRFELQGPDRNPPGGSPEAEICIVFDDYISEVTIGAKSANLCEAETFDEGVCERCEKKCKEKKKHYEKAECESDGYGWICKKREYEKRDCYGTDSGWVCGGKQYKHEECEKDPYDYSYTCGKRFEKCWSDSYGHTCVETKCKEPPKDHCPPAKY